MQEAPKVGKILLRAKKINGNLDNCEFGADDDRFSPYDYHNALEIFEIARKENITTQAAANRIAEERLAAIAHMNSRL